MAENLIVACEQNTFSVLRAEQTSRHKVIKRKQLWLLFQQTALCCCASHLQPLNVLRELDLKCVDASSTMR